MIWKKFESFNITYLMFRSHKPANFINRLWLQTKLFGRVYFLFPTWAFDEIMKFEMSETLKFGFLDNEKSFWGEIKNIFFLVSMCSLFDLKT